MATERKSRNRLRLINLGAVGPEDKTGSEGPVQEVVDLGLGYRVLISEQAEVWTVSGLLRDGSVAKEDVGELSFALIPGSQELVTAVTGFIAPSPPCVLAMDENELRNALLALIAQLGYDQEGYYLSLGVGGRYLYHEGMPPV